MNFDTPELKAFRAEVRDFFARELPEDIRRKVAEDRMDLPKEDQRRWHNILLKRGWAVPNWPVEWGGPGWDDARQYIFEREYSLADAPPHMSYGITLLGKSMMKFGTETQKNRFLPRIREGLDFWCQGFSEPNSGSDLASLQCKAVREGDHYVVNGSKMWTSEGHIADWIFCLVRTDNSGKKQFGISFLLIDMSSPGVEVKPIWTYDGGGREVNQTFFTDVKVPVANLLGEENQGWNIVKYLLSVERFGTASVSRSLRMLERLRRFAAERRYRGGRLIDDPLFARKLAQVEIELRAVELTEIRLLFGGAAAGPEASLLKLRGTEVQGRILELLYEATGAHAQVYVGDLEKSTDTPAGPIQARHAAQHYFNYRKTLIYAGSNEIQRNIISKAVLGL